ESAAELGIAFRLRVEGIELAQAALQEQVDDGKVFFALGAQHVAPGEESPGEDRSDFQKAATIKILHRRLVTSMVEEELFGIQDGPKKVLENCLVIASL